MSKESGKHGDRTNPVSEIDAKKLLAQDSRHVWHPFTHLASAGEPVLVTGGKGAILQTADGREILDGISSWWVNLFGHGHPKIAEAIADQAARLEQVVFAGFTHPPAIQLATRLAEMLPADLNRVFFSDNGSTTVEVALKIVWQFWQTTGNPDRQRIMVFDGGYHGDTVGAMSAGVASGFFDAWKKQLVPCDVMPWPATWLEDPDVSSREAESLKVIDRFLDRHAGDVAAMIVEPLVQGASGMRMVRPGFLNEVVRRVREQDILVIFDEVMTGFGRTGTRFACEHLEQPPDVICLSKGLTGGFLPMGVTVISDRIHEAFLGDAPSDMFCHGHSYTANPLGCAAALATLDLLARPETGTSWQMIEDVHRQGLAAASELKNTRRPRQQGTIAAIEVCQNSASPNSGGSPVVDWFREENWLAGDVLIRPLGNVVYLMPPYCVTRPQLEHAWQAINCAINEAAFGVQ